MYRTFDTAFWTDPKIRALSKDARYLFSYLFTNSHSHVSGIYYLPDLLISHETGLSDRVLDTLWNTLSDTTLAYRDRVSEVVWVKNMLKYQGRGDKISRSVAQHLMTLHHTTLIEAFLSFYADRGIPYQIPQYIEYQIPHPVLAIQNQEQNKEQEKDFARAREKPTRATACPESIEPTDEQRLYAMEHNLELESTIHHFLNHHRAKGSTFKDWRAALWTWLHNAPRFQNGQNASYKTAQKHTGRFVE